MDIPHLCVSAHIFKAAINGYFNEWTTHLLWES